MFKKLFAFIVVALLVVVLAGCKTTPSAPGTIEIGESTYFVKLNGEVELDIKANNELSLTAAPEGFVQIDGLKVKGVKPGIAIITITEKGTNATEDVTVNICTPGLKGSVPKAISLLPGGEPAEIVVGPNYPVYETEVRSVEPAGVVEVTKLVKDGAEVGYTISPIGSGAATVVIGIVGEETAKTINVTVEKSSTTIAEIKALKGTVETKMNAVLTAVIGNLHLFQDATGALAINAELKHEGAPLVVGKQYEIEGIRFEYDGTVQLKAPFKVIGVTEGAPIATTAVAVAELAAHPFEKVELEQLSLVEAVEIPLDGRAYEFVLANKEGAEVVVRVNEGIANRDAIDELVKVMRPQADVTIKSGFITVSGGNAKVNVLEAEAIEVVNSHEVTINLQGGELAGVDLKAIVKHDGEFKLPAEKPVKATVDEVAYKFKGWSLTENGEELLEEKIAITADTVIYAIYEEIPFAKVTLDLQGGELAGVELVQAIEPGQEFTFPTENPVKAETATQVFTFKHWSLTEAGEAVTLPYVVTADVTLFAVYEETAKVKVTLDLDGGRFADQTLPVEYIVISGETVGALPTPYKRDGNTLFTFEKWINAADNADFDPATAAVTAELTIKAIYAASGQAIAAAGKYVINPAATGQYTFNGEEYYEGINLFKDFSQFGLIESGEELRPTEVALVAGTYEQALEITQSNINISGPNAELTGFDPARTAPEAEIKGINLKIASGVQNVKLLGLAFTGTTIIGPAEAEISNLSIINNKFTGGKADGVIYFWTNKGVANHNFNIIGNEINSGIRHIRFTEIENLQVINNHLIGTGNGATGGDYIDGIKIGGVPNETNTAGKGVFGACVIRENLFKNIGQRAMWIERHECTQLDITQNTFDTCGTADDWAGDIQMRGWTGQVSTILNVTDNVFKDTLGAFHFRINHAEAAASGATLTINVTGNDFLNGLNKEIKSGTISNFHAIEIYNMDSHTINAQGNYYSIRLAADPDNPVTVPTDDCFKVGVAGQIDYSNHATAPLH